MSSQGVIVSGLGGASPLGSGIAEQVAAMNHRRPCLRPLAEHPEAGGACPDLLAGWISDRSWLSGRKYGGASNASVRAARMAVEDAGWTARDLADCHVFSGTSRGNTGELFGTWSARGPVRRLSTSNSMHSETASAVSVELGIRGPWLTLSNGCSSGLDALALAFLTLSTGAAKRALVVGVDFPLMPELLQQYLDTGILSTNNVNDPYSRDTSGMFPGEAVAALALEVSDRPGPRILAARSNSDAYDNIALPADSAPTIRLLQETLDLPEIRERGVSAVCPHASGTLAHGMAEQNALARVFRDPARPPVSLHFMKPFTGHSLGACGVADAVLLCAFLRHQQLPPNLPALTTPDPERFTAPGTSLPFHPESCLLKIAAGMGGRNTIVAIGIQAPIP
jgi:3-oxoacyl-(acyl-carrier-protein) synthase